jgi:hypothetical protein
MLTVMQFASSAVVQLSAPPLVLPNNLEVEVELLWQAEQTRRGKALFNGKIFSAVEISPDTILGRIVEYRHLIAQRAKPELFDVLNVRPVAVSGLLECQDGVVFGRRSGTMTQDAGLWELCPSGGLDTSKTAAGGKMDYCAQILAELHEEIGISPDAVTEIRPFCLVDDLDSHVLDIGIALTSRLSADEVIAKHRAAATKEYDELLIVSHDEVAQFMADKRGQLVVVSAALLEHRPR